MAMKENKLRYLLDHNLPTVATRISSNWPVLVEIIGATGKYDYVEFLAEYAPYSILDFENLARAAELHDMGSIIKVDFQNRAYVAQKALAQGFQGVMLTDHKTADEVRETIHVLKPDSPEYGGRFGYPNARWIGYQSHLPQMDFAKMVADTVLLFMIEKKEAMDNIEEICSVPGVDMVQFGPSDYSMSCGKNASAYKDEYKAAERKMIEVALKHGVRPRCEIYTAEQAKYYIDLGVKDFCIGDELKIVTNYWTEKGAAMRELTDRL